MGGHGATATQSRRALQASTAAPAEGTQVPKPGCSFTPSQMEARVQE